MRYADDMLDDFPVFADATIVPDAADPYDSGRHASGEPAGLAYDGSGEPGDGPYGDDGTPGEPDAREDDVPDDITDSVEVDISRDAPAGELREDEATGADVPPAAGTSRRQDAAVLPRAPEGGYALALVPTGAPLEDACTRLAEACLHVTSVARTDVDARDVAGRRHVAYELCSAIQAATDALAAAGVTTGDAMQAIAQVRADLRRADEAKATTAALGLA